MAGEISVTAFSRTFLRRYGASWSWSRLISEWLVGISLAFQYLLTEWHKYDIDIPVMIHHGAYFARFIRVQIRTTQTVDIFWRYVPRIFASGFDLNVYTRTYVLFRDVIISASATASRRHKMIQKNNACGKWYLFIYYTSRFITCNIEQYIEQIIHFRDDYVARFVFCTPLYYIIV